MTLNQWEQYIGQLAGQPLWSKTIAANTMAFAESLNEDGMTMLDVKQIMLMFVRQLVATGQKIPEGGVYDLAALAETDPVCREGVKFDLQDVERMAANPAPDFSLKDAWDSL